MRIEFDVPEAILGTLLHAVPVPKMALVHHNIPTPPALVDVCATLVDELRQPEIRQSIQAGQSVAIGVGSRGIGRLDEIVRCLVVELKSWGTEPFIFPSMGSHGGATADGQRAVLSHLGITEEKVGAPIRSAMNVVTVGHTADGTPVYLDRFAAEADAITFVARVKPHTAFRGRYESGLAKMIAIGLGKQSGAAVTHAHGFGEMARMVPQMAEIALQRAPIRFGIAVSENAHDLPFELRAVPSSRILADEPAMLDRARRAMPHIPFETFDVLVIDQIGKNISGDGADPNITGRYPTEFATGGPRVNKQVVLDLADASAGNANGIGAADFTTIRAARKMDYGQTYPNALTSTVARPVALPMVLPNDRMAIQAALLTCNAVGRPATLVRITDTLHLQDLWVSESLLAQAGKNSRVSTVRDAAVPPFDAAGNLRDLLGNIEVGNSESRGPTRHVP